MTKPLLILIHGFLGCGQNWQSFIKLLHNKGEFLIATIDLPAHGKNQNILVNNIYETSEFIKSQINNILKINNFSTTKPICLIGYSLGARLLMLSLSGINNKSIADELNIKKVFIISGHLGLENDPLKNLRKINDIKWAAEFSTKPIDEVLVNWYQQSVFANLSQIQKEELIKIAIKNNYQNKNLGKILKTTSLAEQENLTSAIKKLKIPTHFIVGEFDEKFSEHYKKCGINAKVILNSGHIVYYEAPEALADYIVENIN